MSYAIKSKGFRVEGDKCIHESGYTHPVKGESKALYNRNVIFAVLYQVTRIVTAQPMTKRSAG